MGCMYVRKKKYPISMFACMYVCTFPTTTCGVCLYVYMWSIQVKAETTEKKNRTELNRTERNIEEKSAANIYNK